MKKFYATMLLALVSLTAFAQETNDTTYVMFDFNQNPWNYPVSTASKGWGPDYSDLTGAIKTTTDFDWPIAEGSDKKVTVTVYPVDMGEYDNPAILCRRTAVNAGLDKQDGTDTTMTMLFTNPGTTMRFKAPSGYKFGKMLFFFYRSTYFLLDTEEKLPTWKWVNGVHKMDIESYPIWIPSTPKINKNNLDCWEGDETNILFNNEAYFKGNFYRIDMRLVPDGSAGINNLRADGKDAEKTYTLDGREVNKVNGLPKGVYIKDGKKVIVK